MAACCIEFNGRFVVGVRGVALLVGVRKDELWDSSDTWVVMEGESVEWVGMLITWCGCGGVDGLGGGAFRIAVVVFFRGGDRRSNGSAFFAFNEVGFAPIRVFFGETPLLTSVNLKAIEGDGGDGGTERGPLSGADDDEFGSSMMYVCMVSVARSCRARNTDQHTTAANL